MTGSQWAPASLSGSAVTAVGLGALQRRHHVVMSHQVPESAGLGARSAPSGGRARHPSQGSRGPEGIFRSPGGRIGSCGSHRRVREDTSRKFLLRLLKAGTCPAVQGMDLQVEGRDVRARSSHGYCTPTSHCHHHSRACCSGFFLLIHTAQKHPHPHPSSEVH